MAFSSGARARELLLELKRSDFLPKYNDDGVQAVTEEINALHEEIIKTLQEHHFQVQDLALACGLSVHNASMQRNKRCLLAYMRVELLQHMRWETGTVVPEGVRPLLHAKEVDFFRKYDELLGRYMDSYELDLTADLVPPKALYVEVRVLQDCGEVLTDSGPVQLERNTTHYLRRSDVEHLIRQGMLVQTSTDA